MPDAISKAVTPSLIRPAQPSGLHSKDPQSTVESTRDSYIKHSKPKLVHPDTPSATIPPAVIFANLMNTMQNYVKSTADTAELRLDQVGRKINASNKELRDAQMGMMDSKKAAETWETRGVIANALINCATTITGISLVAMGDYWTGGSLIASGVGGVASSVMQYYKCNSMLTGAISVVSGLIGVVGGIAFGGRSLYGNPRAPAGSTLSILGSLTSLIGSSFSAYTSIKQQEHLSVLSAFNALQTKADTALKLLQEKYGSATTAFQGKTKSFSELFTTIAKAQKRYTSTFRVVTAAFRV